MKNSFFILALLLFGHFSFAQSACNTAYEIEYQLNYRIDTLHLDQLSAEKFYLFTGKDCSVFMSYPDAYRDEIYAGLERQLRETGRIVIDKSMKSDFKKSFYKNLQTHQVMTVEKIEQLGYTYDEPELPLVWNIEDQNKTFQNFTVQKATTHFAGRDYTAWFTLEIPIPDGPYLFLGLPGLIVELYDTQDHYHFTLNSLNKLEEERLFTFPKAEAINKVDYQELADKAKKNQANRLLQMTGNAGTMNDEVRINNEKYRRQIKQNQERKNNPIELKD